MKHCHRTYEQDEVNEQRQVGDQTGDFVVDGYADERDRQSNQAGEDARLNRVQPQRR